MESNSKVLNLLQAARLLMSTEFGVTNSPQTAIRIVQELDCSRDIGMILIDAGVKSDSNEEGLDLFTLKGYQKEDMKYRGREASIYRYGFNYALSIVKSHIRTSRKDSIDSMKLLSFFKELQDSVLENDIEEIGGDGTTMLEEVQTQEGIKVGVGSTKQTKGRALRIFEAAMFMERELSSAEKTGYSLEYFLGLATALEDNFTAEESLHEASKTVQQLIDKAKKSEEMTEVETE